MLNNQEFTKVLFTNLIIIFLHSSFVTIVCSHLSFDFFNKDNRFTKIRKWENNGKIYSDIFKIKLWKDVLPELRLPTIQKFRKKSLDSTDPVYIGRFAAETRRSEFTHTIIILGACVFFYKDGLVMGSIIFSATLILNLPFIIIQRYNRPRMQRLLNKMNSQVLCDSLIHNNEEGVPYEQVV